MSALYSGQVIFRPYRWSLSKTHPAQEPVGLEEMKAWSREDTADNDAGTARAVRRVGAAVGA